MRALGALLLLPLATGCLMGEPGDRTVYSPCHALATGGWRAWVERIDVSTQKAPLHRTFLLVEGEVTAPDSDQVRLQRGPVQHLDAPVQQILIRTDGPGTGAPARHRLAARLKPLRRYGRIELRCGDGIVGRIAEVPRRDQ